MGKLADEVYAKLVDDSFEIMKERVGQACTVDLDASIPHVGRSFDRHVTPLLDELEAAREFFEAFEDWYPEVGRVLGVPIAMSFRMDTARAKMKGEGG